MTPNHARLMLGGFMVVSAAITLNVTYMQDAGTRGELARAKAEQRRQDADAARYRRLALPTMRDAPRETHLMLAAMEVPPAAKASVTATPGGPASPNHHVVVASTPAPVAELPQGQALVRAIQDALVARRYEPGTPDGIAGAMTRAAIMAFEHDQGLPLTGDITEGLLRTLQGDTGAISNPQAPGRALRAPRSGHAEQLTRTVQQVLARAGLYRGSSDGRMNDETANAIREAETRLGLKPSGRMSGALIAKLPRLAGATEARAR